MTTQDFTTAIVVNNSAADVYKAINNVKDWWHGQIDGSADNVNDEFDYRFKTFHYSRQKVVELVPNKRVVWLVTDSNLSHDNGKHEWTGTRLVFDIAEVNGKTEVRFTHEGLVPSFACYGDCSNGWSMLVQQSLYSLLTRGKGVEVFG